jgi:hypothetical protein
MTTFTRRLAELERRFAERRDDEFHSIAESIRERRRRRLAAQRRDPNGEPVGRYVFDPDHPPKTIAEIIRSHFRKCPASKAIQTR